MDESTRALLRTILAACQEIGSANSWQDHGGGDEAQAMRDRAQKAIANALEAASADDRERIDCLFGPDPRPRFNQLSWTTAEDYIQALLASDPELPVAALRDRQRGFEARIQELRSAKDALRARLFVRYTRQFSPSMLSVFLKLSERAGDPPGWYYIGEVSYHLNLAGEGFQSEMPVNEPYRYDALIDGTWIHVALARATARAGVAVELRARDGAALARTGRTLRAALAAAGWEEVPTAP